MQICDRKNRRILHTLGSGGDFYFWGFGFPQKRRWKIHSFSGGVFKIFGLKCSYGSETYPHTLGGGVAPHRCKEGHTLN